MPGDEGQFGFQTRKKILEEHLRKFHQLRKEGKLKEAMEQFSVTLDYARKSMNHSLKVLEKSVNKIKMMNPESREKIQDVANETISRHETNVGLLKNVLENKELFRN